MKQGQKFIILLVKKRKPLLTKKQHQNYKATGRRIQKRQDIGIKYADVLSYFLEYLILHCIVHSYQFRQAKIIRKTDILYKWQSDE